MCLLEGDEQRVLLKIVSHGRRRMRVSELTPLDLRGSVDTLPKLPIRIESSDEAVPAHLCCPSPWTSAKTALATELRTSRKLPPTYRVGKRTDLGCHGSITQHSPAAATRRGLGNNTIVVYYDCELGMLE